MATKINRLSRQKSIMSINEGNPLESGGHVDSVQVKVENLTDCVDIGPAEMTSLLNQLNAKENNEERLQLLDQFKVPYLFASENLVKILDVTPSVKTRIAMIQSIGPRLKDPGAKKAYFVALFRYAEEKEVVEEVLKVRTKEISSALFKVDNKATAGGRGPGAGAGRGSALAGGRGGGRLGGAGRGPGAGPPAAASSGAATAAPAVPPPTSLAGIFSSESHSGKKSPKTSFSDDSMGGGSGKMSHTPDVKRLPSIDESPDGHQPVTEGVDDVFAMLDDIDANNESKAKKVPPNALNRRSYSREDDLLGTIQEMSEDEDSRSLSGTPFSDMNSSTASLAYSLSSTSTQSMVRHDSSGFNSHAHVHHQPGMEKVPRSPRTVSPGSPPLKTHSGGNIGNGNGRAESPHRAHSPNHSANLKARPPHIKHDDNSHHSPVNQPQHTSTTPPDRIETVQQLAPIAVKPAAAPAATPATPNGNNGSSSNGATIADSTLTLRDVGSTLTDKTPAPSSGVFSPSSTMAVAGSNETPRSSDRAAELRRLHLTPSRTSGLGSPLTSPASTARKTLNASAAAAAQQQQQQQVPVTPSQPEGQISRVLFTVTEEGPGSPAPVVAAAPVVVATASSTTAAPVTELKVDTTTTATPAAVPSLSPPAVKSAIKQASESVETAVAPAVTKSGEKLAINTASNASSFSNGSSNGHTAAPAAVADSGPKPVTPRNTVKFAPDVASKVDDERTPSKATAAKLEIVNPTTPSTAVSSASGEASPMTRTPNGSSGNTTSMAISPASRKSLTPQLVPFSPSNTTLLAKAETEAAAVRAAEDHAAATAAAAPTIVGTAETPRSESPPKPVDIKALRNTFTKKGGAVPMPAPPVPHGSPSAAKPVSKWTPVVTKAPSVAGASQPSRRHSSVTLPEASKPDAATPAKSSANSNPTTPFQSQTMGVPFLSPRLAPVPFNPSPITSQSSVGPSSFPHTLHHAASNPQLSKQASLSSADGMAHSNSTGALPARPALTRRHSDFSVGSMAAAGLGGSGSSVISSTAAVAPSSDLATKCAAVLKMDKSSFLELEKEDGWEGMDNGQMVMFYSYQELIRRNYYKDYSDNVAKSELEKYLCDVEFVMVFDKAKDLFYAQPRWKQMDQKKKAMLF